MLNKKIDLVKIIFGLSSVANLVVLFFLSRPFIESPGIVDANYILKTSLNTYFKYVPDVLIQVIPYWWSSQGWITLVVHGILLILFMSSYRPKISLPLLLLFEYGLYTRTSYSVHHGQFLFLFVIILYWLEELVPSKYKSLLAGSWIVQGGFLYLFSGLYKNVNFWLIQGDAVQEYINFNNVVYNGHDYRFAFIFSFFSRLIYLIELGAPLVIFYIFFKKSNRSRVMKLSLVSLGSIHIGSAIFLSLFTFPIIGIAYIFEMYRRYASAISLSLVSKISTFCIIGLFHLLPFLRINIFPFDFFPLRQSWSLYTDKPRISPIKIKLLIKKNNNENEINEFNTSFHWRLLRIYLSEEYPAHKIFRNNIQEYYCQKPGIVSVNWVVGHKEEVHACKIK